MYQTVVKIHVHCNVSSGGSKSSTPLATSGPGLALSPTYNPVLALSPIYIALCRLPIVLIWLPQLGSSLQGYKHANQIGSRIATPALAPSPTYSPALAQYTGSHNSGLHLKNYRLEIDLQPQTFYSPTHLKDSKLEVELQPLHWLPVLHIALHWPHTHSLHPVLPQGFP